jgi:radical SAM superfamily enzyme YgiQ (UPF0313 family)
MRGLGLDWVCETHLDYLDEELIARMRASGLRALKVGIESPSRVLLTEIRRRQPKEEDIRRLLDYCDRLGVGVTAFYMLGLPGDTRETVEDTIDYAIELNTVGAQFTLPTPYPGTGFFEDSRREGRLLTDDWEQYDIYTPVLRHDCLSPADLTALKASAYQRYYLRPAWLKRFVRHHWRRARPEPYASA